MAALKAIAALPAPAETAPAAFKPSRGLLTPERCRRFVRQRIASRLNAVCDGLLTEVTEGNLAAMKLLLQMAALDKLDSREESSAASLTNQLAFVRKTLAELPRSLQRTKE